MAPALGVLAVLAMASTLHVLVGFELVAASAVAFPAIGAVLLAGARRARAYAAEVHERTDVFSRRMYEWLAKMQSAVDEDRKNVAVAVEQIDRGETPQPPGPPAGSDSAGKKAEPFEVLERAVGDGFAEALQALAHTAARRPVGGAGQVEVFLYVAHRQHSLVTQCLAGLDDLQRNIEDPDLLDIVFGIDHLVTRIRRQAESMAVLGGRMPRSISEPVLVQTVMRQAIGEIEQYKRARMAPLHQRIALPGYVAADVIHLLAELAENATVFSPPQTQVILRAELVSAGLLIEVDDRGLGIKPDKRVELNRLLAAPDEADLRELLRQTRIGLLVAAVIAQRHQIRIELYPNLAGGTQAQVLVPSDLLTTEPAARVPTLAPAAPPPVGQGPRSAVTELPQPARADPARQGAPVIPPALAAGLAVDKPVLPQRSRAPSLPQPPAPQADGDVSEGSANPSLMGTYLGGVRGNSGEHQAGDTADPTG
ncbi:sensor histidine kinase [Streptomyces sp. CNQ-509]|uniref:sensor histidine kinase n=1 Tax=Streptomyces sp. CNQ-509 TaxID=444103 RepID=UPI003464956B